MVDVVDGLHPVVLLQGDGVEPAGLADRGEGGLEPGQGLHGGAGADELVPLQDDQAVAVADRDHRAVEQPVGLGLGGAGLGLGGEGVDIGAGEALDGGDQVGADALRGEVGLVGGHRVGEPGTAVGGHLHPGHRLDAAGQDQVLPAGTNLGGGHVDGFQTGGAEAVLLDAGHRVGQAGRDGGDPGDVGALVADGADHAEHDVVDRRRVQPGEAAADLVDQADDEVDRLGAVQRAGGLAPAARGADRVVDVRFGGHGGQPFGAGY